MAQNALRFTEGTYARGVSNRMTLLGGVQQARVTIAAASPVSTDSARGGLPRRLVVADVGGTFARLALAETLAGPPPRLGRHRPYACAEYPSLAAILADFTSGLGQPVKTAVVAIAGLLDGDVLINSNLPWTVSLSATRAQPIPWCP
ncbi:hypothetical protein G6F40_014731 [Rhizopus arrhizus]|nr:hypothetical protein G6F40_014731 [Rhizopus arrhizus]